MKYYYTSALAAAWMAENFSIEFVLIQDISEFTMRDAHEICHEYVQGRLEGAKFWVDEGSEEMFEPKEGDLYILEESSLTIPLYSALINQWEVRPEGRIILRNNIPFIWPEVDSLSLEN